ncbi:NUDIX hydrolase [Nocardiopsis ganjiahuensis]|uniref:NUDIX hydrolase n=1 Tax=Nocardiopsis ganjiahuensis TaxID=239984 RepID=UPI00034CA1C3|nr:NUDIX domain-containing protein [Nocardiopsis ganjiahuensis]
MRRDPLEQLSLDAALAETLRIRKEFDDAHAWLVRTLEGPVPPVCAEVWAFSPDLEHVLLVRHPWRGWVCPGGTVEHGESPRTAAVRELHEETGLRAEVSGLPAASWVRSYRTGWSPVLGLAYTAVLDHRLPLSGEPGQPAAWFGLDRPWESVFPEDRERLLEEARHLCESVTE